MLLLHTPYTYDRPETSSHRTVTMLLLIDFMNFNFNIIVNNSLFIKNLFPNNNNFFHTKKKTKLINQKSESLSTSCSDEIISAKTSADTCVLVAVDDAAEEIRKKMKIVL